MSRVTTLLDGRQYQADELVELGGGRWSAELNIRHLKTTMGMEVLKCTTVAGVLKELAIFCLVYNLVRAVMLKAAGRPESESGSHQLRRRPGLGPLHAAGPGAVEVDRQPAASWPSGTPRHKTPSKSVRPTYQTRARDVKCPEKPKEIGLTK